MVVCKNARDRDKDKAFGQKALYPLAERLMGNFLWNRQLTERPQLLLEGVPLRHANRLLLAWRKGRVRSVRGPGNRIIRDRFDLLGPGEQCLILGEFFFACVDITQEMGPTPLMDVGPGRKVVAQHALEIVADQSFDDFPRAGVMGLVITDRWRMNAPDLPIEPIFSPARFIGLHCRTGTDGGLEVIEHGPGMRADSVENLNHLSNAHLTPVQGLQQVSDLPNGQTHHRTPGGDQAGQSNPNAPLAPHLHMQIHRRFVPLLTPRAPAFENPMVDHFHRRWGRHIDHLSHSCLTDASQPESTIRTGHDPMLHDLCRNGTLTPMIVPGIPFWAWLLFFRLRLFHIGFDKGRGRRLLLFPFLNAGQGMTQQLLCLQECFSQGLVFRPQLGSFFLSRHGLCVSAKVTSEQLPRISENRESSAFNVSMLIVLVCYSVLSVDTGMSVLFDDTDSGCVRYTPKET
jgi:hypothetical protein